MKNYCFGSNFAVRWKGQSCFYRIDFHSLWSLLPPFVLFVVYVLSTGKILMFGLSVEVKLQWQVIGSAGVEKGPHAGMHPLHYKYRPWMQSSSHGSRSNDWYIVRFVNVWRFLSGIICCALLSFPLLFSSPHAHPSCPFTHMLLTFPEEPSMSYLTGTSCTCWQPTIASQSPEGGDTAVFHFFFQSYAHLYVQHDPIDLGCYMSKLWA